MLTAAPIDPDQTLQFDDPALAEQVRAQIESPDFNGCLKALDGDPLKIARTLLPLAAAFAVSPVSTIRVGAVAVGDSGQFYLGANLEFPGTMLGTTLHAEQSAVLNAWIHGEQRLVRLAVSETPCGHCRQFLAELSCAGELQLSFGETLAVLPDLLPVPFGRIPQHGQGLLDRPPVELESIRPMGDALARRALNAAQRSYTPYTRGAEGFVIEGDNGQFYVGRAAESVAFNPSVPAVVGALNQRNLSSGRNFSISGCAHARLVTALNCNQELSATLMARITKAPVRQVLMEQA